MDTLKLYIAGKISHTSHFVDGVHWRDAFVSELSRHTSLKIISLDPTRCSENFDQNDSALVLGRCNYQIKKSDAVLVYLTDDISIGGCMEMLVAKYYNKPLIGFVFEESKFKRKEKVILGKKYENYLNPYVKETCDCVVTSVEETALFLNTLASAEVCWKNLDLIDISVNYYLNSNYADII